MTAQQQYVEYGARVNAPPPFLGREGSFRFLLLEGDEVPISDLCKRMLNEPARALAPAGASPVEYQPIGSHVMLLVGSAKLSSTAPGFAQMGFVNEKQLSLWIPVMAGHKEGPVFVADRLCMAVPFIFVDNPMSYVGGREDYGFPKSMGIFGPGGVLDDSLTVQAFGGDFDPQDEAKWEPVLDISRNAGQGGGAGGALEPDWQALEELAEADLVCGIGLLADLVKSFLAGQTRQVFLKQFRDCADPTASCYTAIVEALMQVEDVSWAISPDPWSVTVHPLDSHPISTELGVGDQTAQLAVDLKMNMIQQAGVVVAP